MYGKEIVKHLGDRLSLRDSVMLILHQNKSPKLRSLALGIVWNHCVRDLAMELFKDSMDIVSEDDLHKLRSQWEELIHSAFTFLSLENVEQYEKKLSKTPLKEFLDEEMPPEHSDIEEEAELSRSQIQMRREQSAASGLVKDKSDKDKTMPSKSKSTTALKSSIGKNNNDKFNEGEWQHDSKDKDTKDSKKDKESKKLTKKASTAGSKKGTKSPKDANDNKKSDRKKTPIQKTNSEPPSQKTTSSPKDKPAKESESDQGSKLKKSSHKKTSDEYDTHKEGNGKEESGEKKLKKSSKKKDKEKESDDDLPERVIET